MGSLCRWDDQYADGMFIMQNGMFSMQNGMVGERAGEREVRVLGRCFDNFL